MAHDHIWVGDYRGWSCSVCERRVELPLYEAAARPSENNPLWESKRWTTATVNTLLTKLFEAYENIYKGDPQVEKILSDSAKILEPITGPY